MEKKSCKENLVFTFFPAVFKKILHVRSSVFNCKQNFIPQITCKNTYKIMFSKLSVSLHNTDANLNYIYSTLGYIHTFSFCLQMKTCNNF